MQSWGVTPKWGDCTVDRTADSAGQRIKGRPPMSEKLLKELIEEVKRLHDTVSIMQQDINCIRNGEYDKPQGASPKQAPKRGLTTELNTSQEW
jgi:hypothetical protein